MGVLQGVLMVPREGGPGGSPLGRLGGSEDGRFFAMSKSMSSSSSMSPHLGVSVSEDSELR